MVNRCYYQPSLMVDTRLTKFQADPDQAGHFIEPDLYQNYL